MRKVNQRTVARSYGKTSEKMSIGMVSVLLKSFLTCHIYIKAIQHKIYIKARTEQYTNKNQYMYTIQ